MPICSICTTCHRLFVDGAESEVPQLLSCRACGTRGGWPRLVMLTLLGPAAFGVMLAVLWVAKYFAAADLP